MKVMKQLSIIFILITLVITTSCGHSSNPHDNIKNTKGSSTDNQTNEKSYKVTFIELGSVKCIPCQQMQSVMKSIETKYGKEVKVDFHDVWTETGKPWGVKFGIEAIPTQVFLDKTGKEYYRHVGYFPEDELVKILQMKGVKLN
jgi:thioredoxin 1